MSNSGDLTDDEEVEEVAALKARTEAEEPEAHFPPVEPSELAAAVIEDPSKQSEAFPTIVADPTVRAGASPGVGDVFGTTDEMIAVEPPRAEADANVDATDLAARAPEGSGSPPIRRACDDFRFDPQIC